jgi:putative ABC transport system permease protein
MTFRDQINVSAGNLRRMKLRTLLTSSGIVIAIAAFVAMLSFGAGSQQNIEGEFEKLGLLSMMQVSPARPPGSHDTVKVPRLDDLAIERISAVHGVELVYPYDTFDVLVEGADTIRTSKAQALPVAALKTRLHANVVAGRHFESDTAREVLLSREIAQELGFALPDSAIGKRLFLSVRVSTVDSGLSHVVRGNGESLSRRLRRVRLDSLMHRGYRTRILRTEANEALRRFVTGYLGSKEAVRDTVFVAGIRESRRNGPMRGEPIAITVGTARRFSSRGPVGGLTELFSSMSKGSLFSEYGTPVEKEYPSVSVSFNPRVPYRQVRDSIQSMGFRVFSFAEQFENMQRFFLYFDIGLGVIGMIALLTASLGIVNTMVMSISERRREIGILKSLGADDSDVRRLFLVESGMIGLIGTMFGVLFGWLATRILAVIASAYLRNQGLPEMEFFALPPWLLLVAVSVGIGVSVLAGTYPAVRAARVDPVQALRGD